MNREEENKWFPCFAGPKLGRDKSKTARATMYCLSHAGGSHMDFCTWDASHTSEALKIRSICLPGRAHRHAEPVISSVTECAAQLADVISRHAITVGLPFAIFGQSYGTLLVYETVLRLTDRAKALLVGVVVAARMPPDVIMPDGEERLSIIEDDLEFIEKVISKWGDDSLAKSGLADKIRSGGDEKAAVKPFVDRLRADVHGYENYLGGKTRLPCAVFACRGRDDKTTTDEGLKKWISDFATEGITKTYDGGHFFTRDENIAHLVMADAEKFVLDHIPNKPVEEVKPTIVVPAAPVSQEEEFLMCF